jgi:uncharacterized damage-inducible protein DinB
MEPKDFIRISLDRVKGSSERAVKDLTLAELKWQPSPEGNSMGLIFFHMARAEDMFVQTFIQGKPRIWNRDNWSQKLNIPENDSAGMGYTAEQVAAFVPPDIAKLQAYANAVRAETLEYVNTITTAKLDEVNKATRFGEVTLGDLWTIILTHLTQHAGELLYLRGLQKGINK